MDSPVAVGSYAWLDFNNPMSGETADALVAQHAAFPPATIVDVGCGWAELLLRLLAACPEAVGHGIDHDERLIERAERNAAERSLSGRVRFSSTVSDAGPADLVLNVGAEHVFGTLADALTALWDLVRPGGRLLLGTQFWERPPTPEVEAAIGELPTLDGLVDAAVAAGWRPLGLRVATEQDWDEFEHGFLADWEQVVMSTAAKSARDDARRSADAHRAGYLARRGTLGFAFLTLGRPIGPAR